MKKRKQISFYLFLLLFLSFSLSEISSNTGVDRSTWSWSITKVASVESDMPSHHPDLAIDSENNIHVVWEDTTDGYKIYYSVLDYQTNTWAAMECVSPDSSGIADRPNIIIDDEDTIHVFWMDDTNYYGTAGGDQDICYSKKTAVSTSWSTVEIISTESSLGSYYPVSGVDDDGNLHVVWYDSTDYLGSGVDPDIFYKKWYASSSSWGTAEVVSTESDDFSGVPSMCVNSDGEVFVAWKDSSNFDLSGLDQDIFFKRKDLSGDWSYTSVLSWSSDLHSEYVKLACGDDGKIHAVWNDYSDVADSGTDIDILYCSFNPNLESWSNIEAVSDMCILSSSRPDVTVDIYGEVHVVWQDSTPYGGSNSDYDIMYRIKDSSSQTWSQEYVVSTDNDDNSYYAEIQTDEYGYAHIVWQDAMDYLDSGSDYDIFYRKFSGQISGEENDTGIFQNIEFGEIIILAGIVGGFQIILAIITFLALRRKK